MENTANLGLFAEHKIVSEIAERIYAYMGKTRRRTKLRFSRKIMVQHENKKKFSQDMQQTKFATYPLLKIYLGRQILDSSISMDRTLIGQTQFSVIFSGTFLVLRSSFLRRTPEQCSEDQKNALLISLQNFHLGKVQRLG